MPVGTRGAVRTLSSADLEALGAEVVLGNTYHLMLRPGADAGGPARRPARLRRLGRPRPHRLGRLPGLLAGAQGRRRRRDVRAPPTTAAPTTSRPRAPWPCRRCSAATSRWCSTCARRCRRPTDVVRTAVERTALWAGRAREAFVDLGRDDLNQFGIVQGGVDLAMRAESAERTVEVGFDGYAHRRPVGGGGPQPDAAGAGGGGRAPARRPAPLLHGPRRPRWASSTPSSRGVDMFDCVLPTRLARHGTILTGAGRLNLRNRRYAGRPRAARHRPARARCAPAGRGPTCATCSTSTSPPPPAC